MQSLQRPALRGAFVGTSAAIVAFAGVYVALAATQAGIEEAQRAPTRPATTVAQAGIESAQASSRATPQSSPTARPVARQRQGVPVKQAGLAEASSPSREVKKDKDDNKDRRDLASVERAVDEDRAQESAPAPVQQQAPSQQVQQAPAPVRQAPVPIQQAPSYPVQQAPAPAPAPAPVQQAPAPAPAPEPGITIDLGGRGAVVPQAPIAPKQLHIG